MCGIAGIYSTSGRPVPARSLRAMLDAQHHRGPDMRGAAAFGDAGPVTMINRIDWARLEARPSWCVLGHNRLSILDLSEEGAQPMLSPAGRTAIVFNGEIYNYLELRAAHFADEPFRSSSDTEILLRFVERHGVDRLRELNGMWAFAALDVASRQLTLSRDRFGVKPLYMARTGDFLLFASEIKALFASGLLEVRMRCEAVSNYLIYNDWMPQDGATFYEGVRELPPSHSLIITASGERAPRHFSLSESAVTPTHRSFRELVAEHRATFRDAVRLRLRSDVPVGSCLSGGVDSANVAAAASGLLRVGGQRLNTFTIRVQNKDNDETAEARRISALNGCHWHELPVEKALRFDSVRDFIRTGDEPKLMFGSIVQYELYRYIAQRGVKVVLDGQGGDEAYGGYTWLYRTLLDNLRGPRLALAKWWIRRNGNADERTLRNYLASERDPAFRLNAAARGALLDASLDNVAGTTWHRLANARTWQERQAAAYFNYELKHLLLDGDRNAMRWGVESRYPFLDYRIPTRTHLLPQELLMRRGWTKYVSRSFTTEAEVPRDIMWSRKKKGFYVNLDRGFRPEALAYVHANRGALDAAVGGAFDTAALLELAAQDKVSWWYLLSLTTLQAEMSALAGSARRAAIAA